jgi:hypothetical protein
MYFFIIAYPALPFHAGIDIGYILPVLKIQRVLVALLIVCWMSKKSFFYVTDSFRRFSLTIMFMFLVIVYAVSYVLNGNPRSFIFESGNFLLESFMITLVFYDVLKDKSKGRIQKIYLCIAMSCLIPFLLGIVEYVFKYNVFSAIAPYRGDIADFADIQLRFGIGRVKGAFPHSIDYGVFFALVVPAGLLYLNSQRKEKSKEPFIYSIIFLIICFFGCYISLSRLSLVVFIISAVVLLAYLNVFRAVLIIILASMFFLHPYIKSDIKDRATLLMAGTVNSAYSNSEMVGSAHARIRQIKLNSGKFIESPFFGYGVSYDPGILDNYYLSLLIRVGLLGLTAYLSFFVLPMVWAFQELCKSKNRFSRGISFTTLVIIFSALLIFSVLSITHYLYIYFIYLGIFMAMREKDIMERKNGYIGNYS